MHCALHRRRIVWFPEPPKKKCNVPDLNILDPVRRGFVVRRGGRRLRLHLSLDVLVPGNDMADDEVALEVGTELLLGKIAFSWHFVAKSVRSFEELCNNELTKKLCGDSFNFSIHCRI